MPQDHPVILGRDQLHAFFDSLPSFPEFTQTCDYLEGDTERVVVRGAFSAAIPGPDGHLPAAGKYLATVEKRESEWFASAICFNWDSAVVLGA